MIEKLTDNGFDHGLSITKPNSPYNIPTTKKIYNKRNDSEEQEKTNQNEGEEGQ